MSRSEIPSVITFRLSDMRSTQVNHYLTEVLDRFTDQLETGAMVSVNERGVRVRSLPVK